MNATSSDSDTQAILGTVKKKYGFVPNLIQEMSASIPTAQTYLQGQDALAKGALTSTEQQAVQLTVSSVNECHYCQVAHSFISSMTGISAEDIATIRGGETPSNSALTAVVEATRLLMTKRGWLSANEVQHLEAKEITKPKLYEIIAYIGLKTITNYINHLAQTPVDVQFANQPTATS